MISILNDSYNISNIFYKYFDNLLYSEYLIGNRVIFLLNENIYIGMLIYKINKFDKFTIITIEELCIINKYKSNGFSKILINSLVNEIKKKYVNCYLSALICDLRSLSTNFMDCEIIFPNNNEKNNDKNYDNICDIIDASKNILIKWYMIELNKKYSIYHIPFYTNPETFKIFNSNKNILNCRQIQLKKILKRKKFVLGYGCGVLHIIKIC